MISSTVKNNAAFIADSADVIGDVTLKNGSSVWFNATVRGDAKKVVIGENSNIQDNSVLHVEHNCDVIVGDNVTIGHSAIVHGCTIGDNTMVGMGSIVMNRAKIGKNCIIGAGALVTEDSIVPDNSLVIGVPGKVVRSLNAEEIENIKENGKYYAALALRYAAGEFF